MFKLGHYMAQYFDEMFNVIDRDLENYGIKHYAIKNMTLEQVFLAIGDQELKNDLETDKQENRN